MRSSRWPSGNLRCLSDGQYITPPPVQFNRQSSGNAVSHVAQHRCAHGDAFAQLKWPSRTKKAFFTGSPVERTVHSGPRALVVFGQTLLLWLLVLSAAPAHAQLRWSVAPLTLGESGTILDGSGSWGSGKLFVDPFSFDPDPPTLARELLPGEQIEFGESVSSMFYTVTLLYSPPAVGALYFKVTTP